MFFRRARDERGSIVIAVAALSVIASLGAVIITRAIANTRSTLAAQQRAAATALLDYAASIATARIDLGESASFTDTGTINGVDWGLGASKVDDDHWTVRVAAGAVPNSTAARFTLLRSSGGGFALSNWREEGNWSATLAVEPGPDADPGNQVTSGLDVALDADALANLSQDSAGTTPVTAVGQPVCKWADTSGSVHHATQATTAQCPVYGVDSAGGYLEFDANGYLTFAASMGPDFTAFVVAESTQATYSKSGWLMNARAANGFIMHPWVGTTTFSTYLVNTGGGYSQFGSHTVSDITATKLYEAGASGTYTVDVLYGENGATTVVSNTVSRAAATVTVHIGADSVDIAGRKGKGRYREILMYDRLLDTTERAQVEAYLMNKWGIG
ncbi:MAG: hypothetical protein AB7L13_23800 [Acidimicrobiia bacterium]